MNPIKLKPKQRAFLAVFTELGNLKLAARLAKVARRSHYYWLKKPDYAAAFADAREEAYDRLHAEAWRRAVRGVEVPVLYRGKPCYREKLDPETGQMRSTGKPLTTRRYSDRLLVYLLETELPEKYGRKWKGRTPRR